MTSAPASARAGTRVTAVAPLPTTATRRPRTSRSSGQSCGWTTRPWYALDAGEGRRVAGRVVVVAGAPVEERTGPRLGPPVGENVEGPARLGRRPLRTSHFAPEPDPRVDAVCGCGLPQVLADLCSPGTRVGAAPGRIREAQRVHVRVGAHAREPEEVPGAADRRPRLEDRERGARSLVLQVPRRADPAETGPDDENVDVPRGHQRRLRGTTGWPASRGRRCRPLPGAA